MKGCRRHPCGMRMAVAVLMTALVSHAAAADRSLIPHLSLIPLSHPCLSSTISLSLSLIHHLSLCLYCRATPQKPVAVAYGWAAALSRSDLVWHWTDATS